VSGAGDTVIAVLAAAVGAGASLPEAAELANVAAGIVVGKVGTAVVHPRELTQALYHQKLSSAEQVLPLESALETIGRWRRQGYRWVSRMVSSICFTMGILVCFHRLPDL